MCVCECARARACVCVCVSVAVFVWVSVCASLREKRSSLLPTVNEANAHQSTAKWMVATDAVFHDSSSSVSADCVRLSMFRAESNTYI